LRTSYGMVFDNTVTNNRAVTRGVARDVTSSHLILWQWD